MESGVERAALESNVDVATPADAYGVKQVRYTNGHGVKKSLDEGECELFLEERQVEEAKQVVHHSL